MVNLNKIQILPANTLDYPVIQNIGRFYVYELSRYCGFISKEWNIPSDGLYESFDFKIYFEDSSRKAYIIKTEENELIGFVLLNKEGILPETEHNMGEFFVLAKFQGKKIGEFVTSKIFQLHPGKWEISVIPENKPALAFWRRTISKLTQGNYNEDIKNIDYDRHQPKRYILSFSAL
ncbi:MAG: GNAT family N-acetyltransferase [Rickettsiales bacterium]|jgi:predicted acetyltransferase|nr:GNAT family N-acetyltransferase [Rickettsiales bacterium]